MPRKRKSASRREKDIVKEALNYGETDDLDTDEIDVEGEDDQDFTVHGAFDDEDVDDDIPEFDADIETDPDDEFDSELDSGEELDQEGIIAQIEDLLQQLSDLTDGDLEDDSDLDTDIEDEGDVEGDVDDEVEDEDDEFAESYEAVKSPSEMSGTSKKQDATPDKPKGKATSLPKGKNNPDGQPVDPKEADASVKKNSKQKKASLPDGDLQGAVNAIKDVLHKLQTAAKQGNYVPKASDLVKMENLKIDMSEDVSKIEGLSEAFKPETLKSVQNVLEAKVKSTVAGIVPKIQEAAQAELDRKVEAHKEIVTDAVDRYIDYKMAEFFEENKLVMEEGINTEINESLMKGMFDLFKEHNIAVPEGKQNALDQLSDENKKLQGKVSELSEKVVKKHEMNIKLKTDAIILEESSGLSSNQAEEFKGKAKDLKFESAKGFRESVRLLKKTLFTETTKPKKKKGFETLVEHNVSDNELDDEMKAFLKAFPSNR